MGIPVRADERLPLTITARDRAGNIAPLDGVPVWSSSDLSLLTLAVAADGLSAFAIPVGPIGTCRVNVTADADLGDGVRELIGTALIDVMSAEAVTIAIVAGTPEPQ